MSLYHPRNNDRPEQSWIWTDRKKREKWRETVFLRRLWKRGNKDRTF